MKNISPSKTTRSKRNHTRNGSVEWIYRDRMRRIAREMSLKAVLVSGLLCVFSISASAANLGRNVELAKVSDLNIASGSITANNTTSFRIHSPLPFDAEALSAAKAAAKTNNLIDMPSIPLAAPSAPTVIKGFLGMRDATVSPPDTTGAVGKTRYIELSNAGFRINDKNTALRGLGSLALLFGWPANSDAFDPQVIWDPSKNRFFITGAIIVSTTQYYLAYVFSKTDTPNSFADFCQYALGPFLSFPDYPKLGDTKDVVLVGVNTFTPGDAFIESDIISISKPPAGTVCPDPQTFTARIFGPLKTSSGTQAFTPVPANQIDGSSTGWVVGIPVPPDITAPPSNELVLWKVTSTQAGDAAIASLNGKEIPVPFYTLPQNAPQPGTTNELDTLDTRLTQAVSAVNPARGGKVSLWTQHTVSHQTQLPPPYYPPSGAEVRWYEIDPLNNWLYSRGKLTSTARFYFNGAISPDRVVNGKTKKFGNTMVLQASGTATGILPLYQSSVAGYSGQIFPSIFAVSKQGDNAQSAVTLVKEGTQILDDFTCTPLCRWGDYAGLTPDPTPPNIATRTRGRLWGNNELGGGASSPTADAPWQAWNFIIDP